EIQFSLVGSEMCIRDRSMTVQVFDLVPGGWPLESLPQRVRLRASSASTLHYHLQPLQRGHFRFEGVHLRMRSPWRLWWQQRTLPPA
ncbi:hypothetical protein DNP17_25770, partial [Salmonella enterica subsp. enterica serovar Panama]|uniref:hypothetical protein n=1 Tax=Salmonella enterica TaxID=28901 RepID=UPI00119309DE